MNINKPLLAAMTLITFVTSMSSTVAQAAPGASSGPSMVSNIVMLVGFIAIFYFMLIRPQAKRAKAHQALIAGIAPEDEVVVLGGLLGKVTHLSNDYVTVAIANGVEVKVQKQAVSQALIKNTIKSDN